MRSLYHATVAAFFTMGAIKLFEFWHKGYVSNEWGALSFGVFLVLMASYSFYLMCEELCKA
jgi:hypothetical protein